MSRRPFTSAVTHGVARGQRPRLRSRGFRRRSQRRRPRLPSLRVAWIRGRVGTAPPLRSLRLPTFELARSTLLDGALALALGERMLMAHSLGSEAETIEIEIISFFPFCPVPGAMSKVRSRREGERSTSARIAAAVRVSE